MTKNAALTAICGGGEKVNIAIKSNQSLPYLSHPGQE